MKDKSKEFYVYLHKNSVTNEVFYVGKGKGLRAQDSKKRSISWKNYLRDNNCSFVVEYVQSDMTMYDAEILEEEMFGKFTGLVNIKKTNKWQDNLLEISNNFNYDESSPTFLTWKTPRFSSKRKIGDIAGHVQKNGYCTVMYNNKPYLNHRLVWVMFNGQEIPFGMVINHKDCNPSNNAINNLECVSFKENNRKKKHHVFEDVLPTNTSGINGVYKSKTAPDGDGGKEYFNWTAICYENEEPCNRSFSILKYGDSIAKEMATAWRIARESFDFDRDLSNKLTAEFNSKYSSILTREFPIGISLCKNHGKPAQTFEGSITISGEKKSKRFSVNKYGYDEAYRLACEWRKQMEELYYK